jgi:hypothetical protein
MINERGMFAISSPMKLLILEDDVEVVNEYYNIISSRHSGLIKLTDTNCSDTCVKLLLSDRSDGVIVDIELHRGTGSGVSFLSQLHDIEPRPIIFVTTNVLPDKLYEDYRKMGADMIYHKWQRNHTPGLVLNDIYQLWKARILDSARGFGVQRESAEDRNARIRNTIADELDTIGVSMTLVGRTYLSDAVFLMLTGEVKSYDKVLAKVAMLSGKKYETIYRAIQTAIQRLWDGSKIEHLAKNYTAHIDIKSGYPTPVEFISYYTEKINRYI